MGKAACWRRSREVCSAGTGTRVRGSLSVPCNGEVEDMNRDNTAGANGSPPMQGICQRPKQPSQGEQRHSIGA